MKKILFICVLALLFVANINAQGKHYSRNDSTGYYPIKSVTNWLSVTTLDKWTNGNYNFFIYNKSDTGWLQGSFDSAFTIGNTFDLPPSQWTPHFEYPSATFRKLYLRRKYNTSGTLDFIFEIHNTK